MGIFQNVLYTGAGGPELLSAGGHWNAEPLFGPIFQVMPDPQPRQEGRLLMAPLDQLGVFQKAGGHSAPGLSITSLFSYILGLRTGLLYFLAFHGKLGSV